MTEATLDPAGQWYSIYEVLRERPLDELRGSPTLWHTWLGIIIDSEVRNGGWPQAYWNLRGRISLDDMAQTCAVLGGEVEAALAIAFKEFLSDNPLEREALDEGGPFGLPGRLQRRADDLNRAYFTAEPSLRVRLQEYIWTHRADARLAAVIAEAAPYEAFKNQSPLHGAAHDGNLALMQRELARGVDANIEDDDASTPLIEALGRPKGPLRAAMLDALIEAGADVNRRNWAGRLAPTIANMDGDVLKRLIAAGYDVTRADDSGNTLLHQVRDFATARTLLKAGLDPNHRSEDGITPLHLAAMRYASAVGDATTEAEIKKALSVVRALVKAGAVNSVTPRGQDAFWFAAEHDDSVRGLLDLGLRVMTETDDDGRAGQTALHRAAANRFIKPVKSLLKAGAPINARTREADGEVPVGATPLTVARLRGKKNVANALIKLGAEA